jgi:hypothetical protein
MKTIHLISLSFVTGVVLLSACKKDEQEFNPANNRQNAATKFSQTTPVAIQYSNWQEDFNTYNSLVSGWNLYGTPQPQWVSYAFNRYGLFDNNGQLPNGSSAVSKRKIGNGYGYVIESEVYINVNHSQGTTICPEIGVTRYTDQPQEGISMKLIYIGEGVTSVPPAYRNHTFVRTTALLQNGTTASSGDYAILADDTRYGWHKMKIIVNSLRQVSFYLDDRFLWSPHQEIQSSLMKDRNVLLGFTSPGISGKAYHDWVKVSYPALPDPPVTIDDNISSN